MKKTIIIDLFKNIIIHNKLRSIRSVFQFNNKQTHTLNYTPPYQRNYVWTDVKATYLVETILLHGEIPPIVLYIKGNDWEVIDGRQRVESIYRFIRDEFQLKNNGLDKLWHLAGKKFSQLDDKLKDRILDTSLRLIQITATNDSLINSQEEEIVKREIFKRYNLGISPLKKEEVFKAQYIQDKINIYFKEQFEKKPSLYKQVTDIFQHRSKNHEIMMQHIRHMLVLHNVPINQFLRYREDLINIYYDYLSYNMTNKGSAESPAAIFDDFKKKCDFIWEIKEKLHAKGCKSNGVIFECLYWALSICQNEQVSPTEINNPTFKERLTNHIEKQIQTYHVERNNNTQHIIKRYNSISTFFTSQLDIAFIRYLKSDDSFLESHKEKMQEYMETRFAPGKEEEHFSKMDPTSTSVGDILDKIKRGKFKIKPSYQRSEVMSIAKASSLIESILLGIKIHPLYIYLRKDGVAEVIDGQQRLLTIIGFLGEHYIDENGKVVLSKKNNFSLNLREGILTHLHGKKFSQLSEEEQSRIRHFDLEIIEIKEENNKHFLPEELFKRINHKPMPIDKDTFEFWNAYIDSDIIDAVKDLCNKNKWLYLRKEDKRMLNEELMTRLGYLHYITAGAPSIKNITEILSINKRAAVTVIKFRRKANITRTLENRAFKAEFLLALIDFEAEFLEKTRLLLAKSNSKPGDQVSHRRLDEIFNNGNARVALNFYLLWAILKGIPLNHIRESKTAVLYRISKIFSALKSYESRERIEKAIKDTWLSVQEHSSAPQDLQHLSA
ncbi:DUF262 domain-containing protein [Chitinophaga qingshengii]|uniref:DUF262 domain-containing protein n=1 Tax=Chitinophaga qingshengii TaxID=1569794 RepID=A0ABR7TUG8_9BACT|nr:DUF262 domain-containing protein [Chitinophaga qingshengii]MBC9934132.1 DUF262 domain-containing protein [Chitinophaga qingshengii]